MESKGNKAANSTEPNFKAFADELIESIWNGKHINEVDIQQIAIKYGLINVINRTEPCGTDCECKAFGHFPQECLDKSYD